MENTTIQRTTKTKKLQRKINYYKVSLEEIEKLNPSIKPKLMLHACCGPCSCFPLTFLCPHYDVTIFFNNSNIYPSEEYERRLNELKKLLDSYRVDYGWDVKIIITPYKNEEYMKDLLPYQDLREGGVRCRLCYEKRMSEAYDYAEEHGFDYFCTVMTISRQKNSQIMNEIGKKLESTHKKTKYFYSDFKKNNGLEKAKALRLHYEMYNQQYCGCEISYRGYLKKLEMQEKTDIK